jgi:hypothetical protein
MRAKSREQIEWTEPVDRPGRTFMIARVAAHGSKQEPSLTQDVDLVSARLAPNGAEAKSTLSPTSSKSRDTTCEGLGAELNSQEVASDHDVGQISPLQLSSRITAPPEQLPWV